MTAGLSGVVAGVLPRDTWAATLPTTRPPGATRRYRAPDGSAGALRGADGRARDRRRARRGGALRGRRGAAGARRRRAELGRLDELAAECRAADARRRSCSSLFATGRFTGNAVDYYDPRNSYLDQVLARGLGIPITLSVLAIEVGRRVGVPLVGVGMPGHFLVRDQVDPDRVRRPVPRRPPARRGRLPSSCSARTMGRQAPWHDGYLDAGQPRRPSSSAWWPTCGSRSSATATGAACAGCMRLRVRCPGATDDDQRRAGPPRGRHELTRRARGRSAHVGTTVRAILPAVIDPALKRCLGQMIKGVQVVGAHHDGADPGLLLALGQPGQLRRTDRDGLGVAAVTTRTR